MKRRKKKKKRRKKKKKRRKKKKKRRKRKMKGSEIPFDHRLLDVLVQCSWWPGRAVGERMHIPLSNPPEDGDGADVVGQMKW
jgi:hypothetical protein